MILAFYSLAKILFKNPRESLFSTMLFIVVSGFSWFYLLTNPPPSILSGNEFRGFIWEVINKFGTESGAKISFIYADDHALVRLWSLGLCFASIMALSKHLNVNQRRGYLLIFSVGFIQIALGHYVGLILLALLLFALTFLISKSLTKEILFSLGIPTLLIIFLAWVFSYFRALYFVVFLPLLALVLAGLLRSFINGKHVRWDFILRHERRILSILAIIFILYYGLSWIAFAIINRQVQIETPIFTLWYSLPIQFGFLGFLFTLTLAKNTLTKWKHLDFSLKFVMLMFGLLLISIAFINYSNLHLFYLIVPAYLVPYYFLPFFALASPYILKGMNFPNKELKRNVKSALFVSLLVLLLLFGSFSHIMSASYWNTSGWWKESSPFTSLSDEEIQFVNFLYSLPPKACYEIVGFLPKDQPFPLVEASQYQKMVRYRIYDVDNLIFLSGMRFTQKLSMSVLYDAQDPNEIIFLKQVYPIEYLIVDKNATSFLAHFMKENRSPIFDGKYIVYDLSDLQPITADNSKSEGVILVDEVSFTGNLTFTDEKYQKNLLNNVAGALSPLEKGYTSVKIYAADKGLEETENFDVQHNDNQTSYREESNPKLTDGKSDDNETCVYDDDETFWSSYAWGSGNLTAPTRSEETTEKAKGSSSLKVEISTGGTYEVSVVHHSYSEPYPDWTGKDFIGIYLYGLNDGGTITVAVYGGGNSGPNAYFWCITDNFSGWKRFVLPINNPNYKGSDFDITSINEVHVRWNTAGTKYIDRMVVDVWQSMEALISEVKIEGETTLINMRSTWNYFPETMNVAQKVVIHGEVHFKVLNTFGNKRLYITSFENVGNYEIYPKPWHVAESTAKLYIQEYVKMKDIPFLTVLKSPFGITWTIICVVFFTIFTFRKKVR